MMKEQVQKYVSIWNNEGIADLKQVFKNESKYWDAMQEGNAIDVLTESIKSTHQAFSNISFEVLTLSGAGDNQMVLEWQMTGTNTGSFFGADPTGKSIAIKGLDLITLEADRISDIRSYYDSGLFAQQLGLA